MDARIPPRLHFIWIGQDFHLCHALALQSARIMNPDCEIVLHCDDPPVANPHWDSIKAQAELRRIDAEEVFQELPVPAEALRAQLGKLGGKYLAGLSNLYRLAILYREGGIYLDFDTLCVAPLAELRQHRAFVGEENVWRHDQERVEKGMQPKMLFSASAFGISWLAARAKAWSGHHPFERVLRGLWSRPELNNAILGCEPRHPWFGRLLELAISADPRIRFSLGPALVNAGWRDTALAEEDKPARLPSQAFYQFPPSQTSRYFDDPAAALPAGAYVLHWCSSNHRELVPAISREWLRIRARRSLYARHALSFL